METISPDTMPEPIRAQEESPSMPIPYPGFEDFQEDERVGRNGRSFARTMANISTMMLNEKPDHPNKEQILELIESHRRIADMDDSQFRLHELCEANTANKLTQDEKLHCIRTLPVPIVKKLFPHL